ncbi:MAG: hypothetical protein AAF567_19040 [Actinomycetota bacterium]
MKLIAPAITGGRPRVASFLEQSAVRDTESVAFILDGRLVESAAASFLDELVKRLLELGDAASLTLVGFREEHVAHFRAAAERRSVLNRLVIA